MKLYLEDGIGNNPIEHNRDKTFTDDGYMVVGGQLIDLNEKLTKENKDYSQNGHDTWFFLN